MHVTFNIINLMEQVKDLIKGYTDKCGTQYFILSMAGIALTFADSDLGLYITYMETLC